MKIGRIVLSALIAAGCIFGAVGCSGVKSSVGNVEELNFVDGDKLAEITIEGYGTVKAKLFPDLAPNAVENFTLLAEQGYYDGLKIHRIVPELIIQGGSLNGDGTGGKAIINEGGVFSNEISPKARHFYGALCYSNDSGDNTAQFYIVNNNEPQDITRIDPVQIQAAITDLSTKLEGLEDTDPEYKRLSYRFSYYSQLAELVSTADEAVINKYKEVGGYPMFDGGYTVFGQIYEGFEVIEALSGSELENNVNGEKSKPVKDIIISSVVVYEYKAPTTAEATEDSDKKEESKPAVDSSVPAEDSSSTAEESSTSQVIDTTETGENAE